MRPSCDEPDAVYGAAMLTLRINMALSRVELAHSVGVSRQAVGEWERGCSYPKAEHLQTLIALAVQKQAFAVGPVAEEIRQLWKVAHQKLPLDERWPICSSRSNSGAIT
jgi:DNA-binding XRE family transcriptional regulator